MITVTLYSRKDCHLCDQAIEDLNSLREQIPHELLVVDIDGNRDLDRAYGSEIPVVEAGPYTLKAPFTREDLAMTLNAATDRARDLESIHGDAYQARLERGWKVTSSDRFSYWLSSHYMAVFNLLVLVYFGLPFLAPVLMVNGVTGPANLLYKAYGAVCHQFAFRSFFLFGEQPVYPRSAAGVSGLIPYGAATGMDEGDVLAARSFIGNPVLGYKVAICERDLAIYGGILLFGLVFALANHRIKSLPWYFWILIGIFPIALDGFSQLFSQPPFNAIPPLNLLNYRESTPYLRVLTGLLFGITTAWFGYPIVEETMADTRRYMAAKIARVRGAVSQGTWRGV
jgi:uncharacterized membrane protein